VNLKARGLSVAVLEVDNGNELAAAKFQVVFSSPEMQFMSQRWRVMLTSETYSSRIQALIIDKAHTCKQWYAQFHAYTASV